MIGTGALQYVYLFDEVDRVESRVGGDLLEAALVDENEEPNEKEVTAMTVADELAKEVEELKRMRDELRVRIHLGKAEAKELWEKTESKLHEVEGKLKSVSAEAKEPLHDVGAAARLLVDEIKDGYKRIRDAL